jgi:hypothetical protein
MAFIVLGLPRSRTAWLSRFLTYGDHVCGHEELRHCRSLGDVEQWFSQSCIGTSETSAAPFWRLFERFAPDARIVIVRRPVADVVESVVRLPSFSVDREALTKAMVQLDRKLDQVAARCKNVLSVSFAELHDEQVCRSVFEHCLPYDYDPRQFAFWSPINIQIDMRAIARYVAAYRPALEKLTAVAKRHILTSMAVREPVAPAGVVLQIESFDDWLTDATDLIDDHLMVVGETPGDWRGKNLGLMRDLANIGAMQIITARSNGRMFGYLMTILGPSMTRPGVTIGSQGTFYADPTMPGLGLKLQRASIAALKARNVDHVFMQDGVRGSGGRINAIYRRIGAEIDGQAYRLQLSEI